jgi:hypothetical protein
MPNDPPHTPTPTVLALARLRWCAQLDLPELAGDCLGELADPMDLMCSAFNALMLAMSSWMDDQSDPDRQAVLSAALSAFEESWSTLVGPAV